MAAINERLRVVTADVVINGPKGDTLRIEQFSNIPFLYYLSLLLCDQIVSEVTLGENNNVAFQQSVMMPNVDQERL